MKTPAEPGLRKAIRELIARAGGGKNADLVEELAVASLNVGRDVPHRGDVKMTRAALRELSHTLKSFAPYANRSKVTIFGSARTVPRQPEYHQAIEFARAQRSLPGGAQQLHQRGLLLGALDEI